LFARPGSLDRRGVVDHETLTSLPDAAEHFCSPCTVFSHLIGVITIWSRAFRAAPDIITQYAGSTDRGAEEPRPVDDLAATIAR
jgi:hypothetical protein